MTYLFTWSCYATHFTPRYIPSLRNWRITHTSYPPFRLNTAARRLVRQAILEYADLKNIHLLAFHIRETHVHIVASTEHHPLQVCAGCKSAATRMLREHGIVARQRPIWSDYRHIRRLPGKEAIANALDYVVHKQGRPLELWIAPHLCPQQS
jgi:REP element-mobilizing transposase RayT